MTLPPYVSRGGEQVYPQPVALRDVKFSGFILSAQQAALQSICDQQLNLPGQEVEYFALSSQLMLGIADCGKISSLNPPDSQKGYVEEIDVAFWMLVAGVKTEANVRVVDHIAWHLPYVFVNNAWAVACGREVFGFAKEMSDIQVPSAGDPTAAVTVDTLVLPSFGPNSKAESKRLLTLRRTDKSTTFYDLADGWKDANQTMRQILNQFTDGQSLITLPGIGLAFELYDLIFEQEIPLVFLKQFRDATDGQKACYQQIVRAPARVVGFHSASPLLGDFELEIESYDSHPIIQDLGLAGATIPVSFGLQIDFDFNMENGTSQ